MSSFGSILIICAVLGASAAFASVVEDAESQFYQNKAGQPIPGQWIVVFNDQVANPEEGMARYAAAGALGDGWARLKRE